ncbi:N-acetylgalactosamine kinase [Nymphon striatum]|nr:N-acetylgalactosamine kinase [Nymphon striatum]
MTYASETWTLTTKMERKLAATQHNMERSMLNITYKDRKTNRWIREQTKVKDIMRHGLAMSLEGKMEFCLFYAIKMSEASPTNLDDNKLKWIQFNADHDESENVVENGSTELSNEEVPSPHVENNSHQNTPQSSPEKQKTVNWVKFEEGSEKNNKSVLPSPPKKSDLIRNNANDDTASSSNSTSAAVISPNQHETLQSSKTHPLNNANKIPVVDTDGVVVDMSSSSPEPVVDIRSPRWPARQTRNPEITQGFANGDCIVSVLPLNQKCPWMTKAEFKPELVPEELMAQGLTLTVEDYVQAMKILVSDFRFNLFIICYKRILIAWILIGFIFLISFLFSGLRGIILFICGIVWLVLNAVGIFFCMWFKIKLSHGLEYCMAEVNSYLFKQKIILALDDRGKLSCHKVNKYLGEMLTRGDEGRTAHANNPRRELDLSRMDIDENGITIVGKTNTVLSLQQQRWGKEVTENTGKKPKKKHKQRNALKNCLLRYVQRWAKDFVRKRLDLNIDLYNEGPDFLPIPARHCDSARCLCQYIEEYLSYKPDGKFFEKVNHSEESQSVNINLLTFYFVCKSILDYDVFELHDLNSFQNFGTYFVDKHCSEKDLSNQVYYGNFHLLNMTSSYCTQSRAIYHNMEERKRIVTDLMKKYADVTPQFFAVAPGRVNLIGEHIDYCGYAVLPMAIQQNLLIGVCRNDSGKLSLHNSNPDFESFSCDINKLEISSTKPKWYDYAMCGVRGIQEHFKLASPKGIVMVVDGTVPVSAGLSSSSALVCACTLATLHSNNLEMNKFELATLAARCEKYVGTEGGGMDQAISFLAKTGKAKLIEFDPLRDTDVHLPDGGLFVIINSGVRINKAATSDYNERVVECRLATQVILQTALDASFPDIINKVDTILKKEDYTRNDVCKALEISDEELISLCLTPNTKDLQNFKKLRGCSNSKKHAHHLKENCLPTLGKLMNGSHDSLRDLYECSHVEVDELVNVCRQSGAIGSRITGAGWGGCTVSLVLESDLQKFVEKVKEGYFSVNSCRQNLVNNSIHVSESAAGAAIYTV